MRAHQDRVQRAYVRDYVCDPRWQETANKNLVIASGSALIVQPGYNMTFGVGNHHKYLI